MELDPQKKRAKKSKGRLDGLFEKTFFFKLRFFCEKTRILQKIKNMHYSMYFIPLLLSEVKKGPYLIVHNNYQSKDTIQYYLAEVTPPFQPPYTTLDHVYDYKTGTVIPNKIQVETYYLSFFKCIPSVLPKLRQRLLHQLLRKITGDESFTYLAFEPTIIYYTWENGLKNNLFPIKHVK